MDNVCKWLFIAMHRYDLGMAQPLWLTHFATFDFELTAIVATHKFHVTILIKTPIGH